MLKHLISSLLILSLILAGPLGCQSTSPIDDLGNQDRINMTLIGAGAGAIIGGIIGHQSDHAEEGALLGAAIGSGAGFVVGDMVAKKRKRYAEEADFLEGEIEATRLAIAAQKKRNQMVQESLDKINTEIAAIEAESRSRQQVREDKELLLARLDKLISHNKNKQQEFEEGIAWLEESLETSETQTEADRQAHARLTQQFAEFREQYAILTATTASLARARKQAEDL